MKERTKAGLEAARARGRKGGRPVGLSKKALDKARLAESQYRENDRTVPEIGSHLDISKPTLHSNLRHRGVEFS